MGEKISNVTVGVELRDPENVAESLAGPEAIGDAPRDVYQTEEAPPVSGETWVGAIEEAVLIAHALENLYAQHPRILPELSSLASRLRRHVAPAMDQQLVAQTGGISWLTVMRTAAKMQERGGRKASKPGVFYQDESDKVRYNLAKCVRFGGLSGLPKVCGGITLAFRCSRFCCR